MKKMGGMEGVMSFITWRFKQGESPNGCSASINEKMYNTENEAVILVYDKPGKSRIQR